MPDTYDPSAWSVIAGFAAFFAIVFLLTCAWLATVRKFQTPASARPAAQLPRAEVGRNEKCSSTGCGYRACMWVVVADDLGGGVRHVCKGCHDEGVAFKWWRLSLGSNPTAFDFEVADDMDRLEQFANGDGAA